METDGNQYKILILVDLDSLVQKVQQNKVASEKYINQIRVCALKLLYSKYSKANLENKQFQWAFKIISDCNVFKVAKTKFKLSVSFQDLTLSNFESFETSLENVLCYLCENKNDETEMDEPAHTLRKELYNIITDYPWNVAEIHSPVKPHGRRRSTKPCAEICNSKYNILYYFSFCPHTNDELSFFTGHTQIDLQSLLHCFMSNDLQHQYSRMCFFNWIDLNNHTEKLATSSSKEYHFMDQALQKINGSVVPIEKVVFNGKLSFAYLSNCKETSDDVLSEADTCVQLPFPSSSISSDIMSPNLGEGSFQGNLFIGNSQDQDCIQVSVTSILKKENLFSNASRSVKDVSDTVNDSATSTCSISVHQSKELHQQHIFQFSSSNNTVQNTVNRNIKIKIVGSIRHSDIPTCAYTSEDIFMLAPTSTPHDGFAKYIMKLAQSNLVHICEVQMNELCVLGILQPLTSVCASLTLLPTMQTALPVHKLLLASSTQPDPQQEKAHFNAFVTNCLKHLSQKKVECSSVQEADCPRVAHAEMFNTGLIEDYFTPGSICTSTQHVFKHLQSDLSDDEEQEMMKCLQKKYMKNKTKRLTDKSPLRKSPRKTPKTPKKSLNGGTISPPLRRSPRKRCSVKNTEDIPKTILPPKNPLKRSRSHTAPTRNDLLWQKCRETIKQQKKDTSAKDVVVKKKGDVAKPVNRANNFSITDDLKTESDLVSYLKQVYEETLEKSSGFLTSIQMIINMAVHFQQSQNAQDPQEAACKVIGNCILLNSKQIKGKHKEFTDYTFQEYEFQVLLHLELETLLRDKRSEEELDDKASQISDLLVPMGIAKNGFLATFLNTVVIDNYVESLPLLLCKIYDETMLPLPPQLEGIFSPELDSSTLNSNAPSSVMSYGSAGSGSIMLPSNKPKRADKALKRYSSFHSVTSRQIALPKQAKRAQGKVESMPRRSSVRIASASKNRPKLDSGKRNDTQKVCKNLFGDLSRQGGVKLERRQSVAVMERHSDSRKTPKKSDKRLSMKTPKLHHVPLKRRVMDTPAHKQKANRTWRKQEHERRRTLATDTVQFVPESPYRAADAGISRKTPRKTLRKTPRKTPKKTPRAALLKRKSFYSMNEEVKEKFEKLEARLTSKILSPVYSESKAKGLAKYLPHTTSPPRRIQPRTLFSSITSPSPKKPILPLKSPSKFNLPAADFDSPCKGTRSQTANLRNIMDGKTSTDTVECTPSKKNVAMKLFQSPVPNRVRHPDILQSPVRNRVRQPDIFQSPVPNRVRQPDMILQSPISNIVKQQDTVMQSPIPNRIRQQDILMSPKSILSPSKGRNTPRKSVSYILPNSPFIHRPGKENADYLTKPYTASPKTQVCLNFSQPPAVVDNENSASSPRRVTRSQTKSFPLVSNVNQNQVYKARTNLSSLFSEDSNSSYGFPKHILKDSCSIKHNNAEEAMLNKSKRSFAEIGRVSSTVGFSENPNVKTVDNVLMSPRRSSRFADLLEGRCSLPVHSSNNKDFGKENSGSNDSATLKRKISSCLPKRRQHNDFSCSQDLNNSHENSDLSSQKKRKISPELINQTSSNKRRRALSSFKINSSQNSEEYFDSEEVFIKEETTNRGCDRPNTKSSLFSDQSDNSRGFGDIDMDIQSYNRKRFHLFDKRNSNSNISVQSEPALITRKFSLKDSFESLESPVFPSLKGEKLFARTDSNISDKTVDSSSGYFNRVHSSKSTMPESLSDLAGSEVSAAPSPIFFSSVNRSPEFKDKLITKESPNKRAPTPFMSPSSKSGRMTPGISSPKSARKFSPLTSSKSLAILLESPLVNKTETNERNGKKKGATPTSALDKISDVGNVKDGDGPRRQTRRSLYRTKTSLEFS